MSPPNKVRNRWPLWCHQPPCWKNVIVMAKGTHCLPNTSCEPDSLQPSPYTPTLRSRDLLTGESLSPPCYVRKIRHRVVGVLLRVTEPGQELCSSVLQNRILLSRGKMVRGEAIGTSWGGRAAADKGCCSLTHFFLPKSQTKAWAKWQLLPSSCSSL